MDELDDKSRRRRGIYLLPNLFTTAALFAGFYAVIAAIQGRFEPAAIAIFAAMLFDGLDGRVARLTNTQSDFGAQYDSLSDMVAFGVAPALVAYEWALGGMGKIGWMAAFVYMAAAALRLARFNTQVEIVDKRYFQGLASPAAAGTLVSTVWFFADQGISGESVRWLMFIETVLLGLLMFSRVRYFSGKSWPIGDRIPLGFMFLLVLIFVLLAIDPPTVLLIIGVVYVTSGIVVTLLGRQQWKSRRGKKTADD